MTPKNKTDCSDKRKLLGASGESIAALYLENKGYKLLERNFRCRLGEIDIIALHCNKLCFVEVKTRKSLKYGLPCQAVTVLKRRHIINTAAYYLKTHPFGCKLVLNFHVVEVLKLESGVYIRMIENAF